MDILTKLGINSTFFVQLINFVILVFILYKVLYKPLFKTIDERTEKIKKGLELTERMENEYVEVENKKNSIIEEAQKEATSIINKAEAIADQKALKIIDEAKQKGDEMIKNYELSLQKERESMNAEINDRVYDSVKVVLKKVLRSDKEIDKQFVSSVIQKND